MAWLAELNDLSQIVENLYDEAHSLAHRNQQLEQENRQWLASSTIDLKRETKYRICRQHLRYLYLTTLQVYQSTIRQQSGFDGRSWQLLCEIKLRRVYLLMKLRLNLQHQAAYHFPDEGWAKRQLSSDIYQKAVYQLQAKLFHCWLNYLSRYGLYTA